MFLAPATATSTTIAIFEKIMIWIKMSWNQSTVDVDVSTSALDDLHYWTFISFLQTEKVHYEYLYN